MKHSKSPSIDAALTKLNIGGETEELPQRSSTNHQPTNQRPLSTATEEENQVKYEVDQELGTTTVPPQITFREVLWEFLKQISTFQGDLSTLLCPSIMLNGISLLEYSLHWAEYPEQLVEISKPIEPEERMVNVCKWFISQLYGSYASRSQASGFERKPYNPILGEQFHAEWPANNGNNSNDTGANNADTSNTNNNDDIVGKTILEAEQVSHHPPISAFYIANQKAGVYVSGTNGQKASMTAGTSVRVTQLGKVFVYLSEWKEEFMISLPELHIRGLVTGSPFIEITGEAVIVSTSNYGARLKFIPKPWFTGAYDEMEGFIASIGDQRQATGYLT
jgi:oxysterol-binding protein-related protein 9/10/11